MELRWVLLGIALVACGDDVRKGPVDASVPADAPIGEPHTGKTLSLPLIAVDTARIEGVPQLITGATPKLVMETAVPLAIGAGYPSEFVGTFRSKYYASCGELQGTVNYRRLEGGTNAIAATLTESSGVRLNVMSEGEAEVVVYGDYTRAESEPCAELPSTPSIPFEVRLRVFAWRAAGMQVVPAQGCSEPLRVATSSTPGLDARLVNGSGEPFFAQNAAPERQLTLTLESDAESTWSLPFEAAGLHELRWPQSATKVSIRPSLGAPIEVEVVDATAVSSAQASFVLAGFVGIPLPLEDGSSYGEAGWHRATNRIVPTIGNLTLRDGVLCSAPDPAWFELTSETPARCDIRPVTSGNFEQELIVPMGYLKASSYVIADGTCTLRLRAKDFLDQRFSVTLQNVAQLEPVP